ncbi:MAG: DNA primase [Puniceicoccales bacterium]|nr:DNA primase [Puniceicoccales bacterium]
MPIISRESIENIRKNVDICDVVSTYVQLKRIGSRWRGLSPFNQEKTPSFFILPEKGIFKCFSSGHAGDIFRFLQLKENFSFTEAVEWLAERYHFSLRYEENGRAVRTGESHTKALLEIHRVAEGFFRECWRSSSTLAEQVRRYWEKDRGFSQELAECYGVGFAPPEDNGELFHRLRKGFPQEVMAHSGLFYASRSGTSPTPRFRGRLMVPIRDIHGRAIAFAGRQLEGITPPQDPAYESKYINSPQTPLFSKGELLFGLDQARQQIQHEEVFLLVEGQLDALRCHSVGLRSAVAPQGTGVTEGQLHQLRRYSPRLWCFLDSDEAGQKAALRVLEMALKEEMEVRFILLPEGQDPDTYLRGKGQVTLRELEALTCSAIGFAIRRWLPQGMAADVHEKERTLRSIFALIRPVSSSVIREAYIREASQLMGIDVRSVLSDFEHFCDRTKMQGGSSAPESSGANPLCKTAEPGAKIHSVTYDLLSLLVHHENLGAALARLIEKVWLDERDPDHALLRHLLESFRENLWNGWEHVDENFAPQECDRLYTVLATGDFFEDPLETANMCLRKLHRDHIQRVIREIMAPEHSSSEEAEKMPLGEEDWKDRVRQKMQWQRLLQRPPQLTPQDIS